jgi:outer membrane protein OmpA-like peptidoglycan-associated protein
MKLTAITLRNARLALATSVCAATLGACHSTSTTPQLRDARRAYDDAEDSPAATYAADELQGARRALDRAENAHEEEPGSHREAQLAYMAGRKAEIARAHGEMAAAERAKAQARANANYQAQLARSAARRERGVEAAKVDRDGDGDKDEVALARDRRPVDDRPRPVDRSRRDSDKRAASALQSLSQVANVKEEQRGIVITISGGLLFPSGEEQLSPIARQSLDQVAAAIAAQPDDRLIRVEGHTDATGSEAQNEQLSRKRAQAVAEYLSERDDIDEDRVEAAGHGESRPIADNDTAEGRSANRRVEIVISPRDRDVVSEDDDS